MVILSAGDLTPSYPIPKESKRAAEMLHIDLW